MMNSFQFHPLQIAQMMAKSNMYEFLMVQNMQNLHNIHANHMARMNNFTSNPLPEPVAKSEHTHESSSKSSPKSSSNVPAKPSPKSVKRPSASKKYPGQLMVGFNYFLQNKLMNYEDEISTRLKHKSQAEYCGKNTEDYKMSSVKKIRESFLIKADHDETEKKVRILLLNILKEFFEQENFENWILNSFRGTQENKDWFIENRREIKSKVIDDIKLHFKGTGTSGTSKENSPVNNEKNEGQENPMKKKIKTEEI